MIVQYVPLMLTIGGTGLLGVTASLLGTFAILREQSLLGDAMSHAALPGIAAAFLLTQSGDPFVLMIGGAVSGLLGALFARIVVRYTTLKHDALLGIVLSVFFGGGLVLLTVIQKQALAEQAILGKFLFGNAATLLTYDILVLSCVAIVMCTTVIAFWKELKMLAFDPQFAYSCGYRVDLLDGVLTILTVGTVVVGLHLVGVLLMSSFLIAPAAAARQWTSRMEYMALIATGIGVGSSMIGTGMSSMVAQVPSGPVIVIIMSICVGVSLAFAPGRGIVWSMKRHRHRG